MPEFSHTVTPHGGIGNHSGRWQTVAPLSSFTTISVLQIFLVTLTEGNFFSWCSYKPGWWFQIFFIFFYFHPYLGKIPILTHIFQMGWFNHQLETIWVEPGCWFNNRTWTEIPSGAAEATSSQSGDRVTRSKGWGIYGFSGRGESVWKFYEFVKIWWTMWMLFGCCFFENGNPVYDFWPSLHINDNFRRYVCHSRYSSSSGSGSSSGQRPNTTRYNIKQLVTTHGLTSSCSGWFQTFSPTAECFIGGLCTI